jgi:hypothetical protein
VIASFELFGHLSKAQEWRLQVLINPKAPLSVFLSA